MTEPQQRRHHTLIHQPSATHSGTYELVWGHGKPLGYVARRGIQPLLHAIAKAAKDSNLDRYLTYSAEYAARSFADDHPTNVAVTEHGFVFDTPATATELQKICRDVIAEKRAEWTSMLVARRTAPARERLPRRSA